tara:strand:- start:3048 stop:3248 length:201 start_codon:yes stop_codon:yes gene_type:complete
MRYKKNMKEFILVLAVLCLALSVAKNIRVIEELRVHIEQNKEEIHQAGIVIAEIENKNSLTLSDVK